MAKKIGIGIVLLAALGGFVAAIIKDKQQCEAAHGKVEIGKVEFEPHSGEYELRVNVVLERKAKLKSWKAVYGGKSFASDDAHGKPSRENLISCLFSSSSSSCHCIRVSCASPF